MRRWEAQTYQSLHRRIIMMVTAMGGTYRLTTRGSVRLKIIPLPASSSLRGRADSARRRP